MKNRKDTLFLALLDDFCSNNSIEFNFVLKELKKNIDIDDSEFNSKISSDITNFLKKFGNGGLRIEQQFTDICKIGTGAFGNVYKAKNVIDEKDYAIKIMKTDNKDVLNECRILAGLDHRNIVRYHCVWMEKNNLYLQMELCDTTLKEHCLNRLKITRRDMYYFIDILMGLNYLHNRDIIHRDLKSSNILINNGVAKICDFNLSRKMLTDKTSIVLKKETDKDMTDDIGTELYSAPEQLTSNNYDKKVDIFSLGIIYYELITDFNDNIDRIDSIMKLRDGENNLTKTRNIDKTVILKMIDKCSKNRPDTDILLKFFGKRFRKISYPML